MVAKDTSKIKSIAQKIAMVPSVGICFDPIAEWQRQYERELRSSLAIDRAEINLNRELLGRMIIGT